MDDDNSKSLSKAEFKKGCNDMRVEVPQESLDILFTAFDINRDGTISYDEFIRIVRGDLTAPRLALVKKAYKIIDKDGNGQLDINDIKGVYNASKHPDVISGKKTEDKVLLEFLETFEAHHNIQANESADGVVTLDEWVEYYTSISSSIDNDEYFALMMNNAWNLNGDSANYKKFDKGWSNVSPEKKN